MPEYKFYSIKRNGHIAAPPGIADCPDDLAAVRSAKQQLDGDDIEIWQGPRVVAYLVPDSVVEKKTA